VRVMQSSPSMLAELLRGAGSKRAVAQLRFHQLPRRPKLNLCSAASAEGADLAINRDV
jgi:hypothetical protein